MENETYKVGENKKFKLKLATVIARVALNRRFSLTELHKEDFDMIWGTTHDLLKLRGKYVKPKKSKGRPKKEE